MDQEAERSRMRFRFPISQSMILQVCNTFIAHCCKKVHKWGNQDSFLQNICCLLRLFVFVTCCYPSRVASRSHLKGCGRDQSASSDCEQESSQKLRVAHDERFDAISSTAAQLEAITAHLATLKSKLKASDADIMHLSKELDDVNKDHSSLKTMMQTRDDEIGELNEQMCKVTAAFGEEKENSDHLCKELSASKTIHTEEIELLNLSMQEKDAKLCALQDEIKKLKAGLADVGVDEEELFSLKATFDQLNRCIDNSHTLARGDGQPSVVSAVQNVEAAAHTLNQTLVSSTSAHREEFDAMKSKIRLRAKRLKAMHKENKKLKSELATSENELENLKHQLELVGDKLEVERTTRTTMEQAQQDFSAEIKGLRKSVAARERQACSLQAEIENLENGLQRSGLDKLETDMSTKVDANSKNELIVAEMRSLKAKLADSNKARQSLNSELKSIRDDRMQLKLTSDSRRIEVDVLKQKVERLTEQAHAENALLHDKMASAQRNHSAEIQHLREVMRGKELQEKVLQREIDSLEAELTPVSTPMSSPTSGKPTRPFGEKYVTSSQDSGEESIRPKSRTRLKLQSYYDQIDNLESQLKESTTKLTVLTNQLENTAKEHSTLQTEMDGKDASIDLLTRKVCCVLTALRCIIPLA